MKPYDYMSDAEVELVRSYHRKCRNGEPVTDEERAANSKYSRIAADLKAGRDPEREARGPSPAFANMTEAEVELYRACGRKQRSGEPVTDEERAAKAKHLRIWKDLRAGRDPEREVEARGPSNSAEYFWSRVDTGSEGCWEWTRCKTRGYGQVKWLGKKHRAHRVAFALANGFESPDELPEGHEVDHMCRNPACCRPDHLQLLSREGHVAKTAADFRGEDNPLAKLTEDQVREILRLCRESDLTQTQIAGRYGVTSATVSDIKTGRSWKHLQDA